MEKLPIYDAFLPTQDSYWDGESGILCCSLVDTPAIESNFMKFSDEMSKKSVMHFSSDDEKRIIVGALMIPDKLIYRATSDGKEFYVRHSKEVISEMRERMMKNMSLYRISLMHNGETLEGWRATPLEVWIKEYEEDKSNSMGFDLPVGTLFMSLKIDDATLWERIKKEEFKGFSLETIMDYKLNTKENFNKKQMTKHIFSKLGLGEPVFTPSEDGVGVQNFSGQFVHEGQKVTCVEGKITTIEPENAVHVGLTKEQVQEIFAEQMAGTKEAIAEMLEAHFTKVSEAFAAQSVAEDVNELKLAINQYTANAQTEPNKAEIEESKSVTASQYFESHDKLNKYLKNKQK